jgi:hypothetical protein
MTLVDRSYVKGNHKERTFSTRSPKNSQEYDSCIPSLAFTPDRFQVKVASIPLTVMIFANFPELTSFLDGEFNEQSKATENAHDADKKG